MQLVEFSARCPFELGDKIQDGGKVRTITDIVCLHYMKNRCVEFMYELDNSGKLVYIIPGKRREE